MPNSLERAKASDLMRAFNDMAGRNWTLNIRVDDVQRVRDLAKVDLLRIVRDGGELLDRLGEDLVLFVSVMWALLGPKAEALGITEAEFREHMHGESLDEASKVLLEELADFFPPSQRTRLALLLNRQSRWEEHLSKLIEKSEPSGTTSIDAPELSAATPAT
jgi:hypothetical protein